MAQGRSRFTDSRCTARQVTMPEPCIPTTTNFSRDDGMSRAVVPGLSPKALEGTRYREDKCSHGTFERGFRDAPLHEKNFIWMTARPESPILATLLLINASRGSIMNGISAVRAGWRAGLCLFAASCMRLRAAGSRPGAAGAKRCRSRDEARDAVHGRQGRVSRRLPLELSTRHVAPLGRDGGARDDDLAAAAGHVEHGPRVPRCVSRDGRRVLLPRGGAGRGAH